LMLRLPCVKCSEGRKVHQELLAQVCFQAPDVRLWALSRASEEGARSAPGYY
jgi:hypothetical protein